MASLISVVVTPIRLWTGLLILTMFKHARWQSGESGSFHLPPNFWNEGSD
jgi:hypothetical protein